MDPTVQQRTIKADEMASGEFAALFAELGRADAVAPVDHGFRQLLDRIEAIKRAGPSRLAGQRIAESPRR